ncbi:MAG TPA: helicase-associated domain-containing protein, partial [Anaerolineaceae bacterium]|nr:helicase-associated domain-containing protein [Anaerolineaceae bacterium]
FIEDFITRWMHWLGLTRIYHDSSGETYFALTPRAKYLDSMMPSTASAKDEPLIAHPDGKILMTDKTAPIARYQVARFAEWLELGPKWYSFQLTPASLAKATQSGLSTRHLLSLLRKYGKSAPPPTLLKALNRWQEYGAEASIETSTILRLKSPEILQALKDSDANTWLGESLSPVAVIVKLGGVEKVHQALARLGYLSDFEIQGPKK